MKRRDYGRYLFTAGLLLLVIQFLIILFDIINGTSNVQEQFVVVEELSFAGVISDIWASALSVVLLIVLYIRRFAKGPDPMLELVGALLWVIQILSLYVEGTPLMEFVFTYILGVLGTVLIVLTGVYDSVYISKQS